MMVLKPAFLIACAGLFLFPGAAFAGEAQQNDIMVQAHSGASALAPENTLAAFREAKAVGASGIETDLRMTKDLQIVVHHDDSINLTSNGEGAISQMTLEELKTYDFGSWYDPKYSGEKILTLEECLESAEELEFEIVNLELKPVLTSQAEEDPSGPGPFVKAAADAIQSSGFTGQVLVTSFDKQLLKEFKEYAPEIPVGILTIPNMSFLALFNPSAYIPADKALQDFEAEDVKDIPQVLVSILQGFGAKGSTPEETMLEIFHAVAAATPSGTTYRNLEKMLGEQSDLISYVKSLDFPVEYLCCQFNSLTEELMDAMHNEGIGVLAWTPDRKADLEKTIAFAPEGVITNHPETALEVLCNLQCETQDTSLPSSDETEPASEE